MAFSHINLDPPGTPPGRNDPCPCGSGKKTKRCCGVDRSRFLPLRGRHRGVVPPDLAARVDQMAGDFTVRFLARTFLPARLGGLSPAALTDEERAELHELFSGQGEQLDQALDILERVGYGRPRGRRPRPERAYGQRRGKRLEGLVGKLPRALAKRLPTSADTHRSGSNDGQDIYGSVSCSQTLRSGHLGILAAAGGLWHSRNPAASPYAETTAGELAQLITGRQRLGGKDIAEIHRLLAQLEEVQLSATVNRPKDGSKVNLALRIPSPPVERVERRLPDGRWVDARAYREALAKVSDEDALTTAQADADADGADAAADALTIRIYLADWVREQIAHGEVVRVDFRVWAHLRPLGQRLYAWLQGTHRDSYDNAVEFYLAAPLRYTVGLRGCQHRAAGSVRAALNQLYASDRRYNRAPKWSIRGRYANTSIPAFRISPHRRGSAPTERALERAKCPAEHPASLRGLTLREAREQVELVSEALHQAAARSSRSERGVPARWSRPAQRGRGDARWAVDRSACPTQTPGRRAWLIAPARASAGRGIVIVSAAVEVVDVPDSAPLAVESCALHAASMVAIDVVRGMPATAGAAPGNGGDRDPGDSGSGERGRRGEWRRVPREHRAQRPRARGRLRAAE
jgi:SEC-C motif